MILKFCSLKTRKIQWFPWVETQINSALGHINVTMLTIYSSFPPAPGPCWIKKSFASHAVACIVPFILFRSEFRLDVYVRCPQLLCRWNGIAKWKTKMELSTDTNECLHGSYKWIIMLEKCGQWFSPQMNNRHPWQLKKKKKSWSYQLYSTANSAHLPRKWTKWAELAVLYSW
jgi:hypothetical protein